MQYEHPFSSEKWTSINGTTRCVIITRTPGLLWYNFWTNRYKQYWRFL